MSAPHSFTYEKLRVWQAKAWWDLGAGKELGKASFEEYLKGIPDIPRKLRRDPPGVPHLPLLTLDDPRIPLTVRTERLGVTYREYGYDEWTMSCYNRHHKSPRGAYWFRAHDGRPNSARSVKECRAESDHKLLVGTASVGLALLLQYPWIMHDGVHVLMLPGSRLYGEMQSCAILRAVRGKIGLHVLERIDEYKNPRFGSVMFTR